MLGVGGDAFLRNTIHFSVHFGHDESVIQECNEIVLVDNFLGKRDDWNTKICVFYHRCPQVKVI